jgi:hypothetical protein
MAKIGNRIYKVLGSGNFEKFAIIHRILCGNGSGSGSGQNWEEGE